MKDWSWCWGLAPRRVGVLLMTIWLVVGCGQPPPAAAPQPTVEATPPPQNPNPVPNAAPPPAPTAVAEARDFPESPIPIDETDPTWGASDALVTLVEFTDLQCPFCARVTPTVLALREKYTAQELRIVWKNNPLPFHKAAPFAHEVAMTIKRRLGDAAFWKFTKFVFENQKDLNEENVYAWAANAGINRETIASEEMSSWGKIKRDMELARNLGATGTPNFRINGVTISGAQPLEKFQEVVEAQLTRAKQLLAVGTERRWVSTLLTAWNLETPAPSPSTPRVAEPSEDVRTWQIPVLPTDPQEGPTDALVTIVEFSDFQCPFCRRVNETLEAVKAAYPKDVRIVWKDNPLPFHPEALNAALLARFAFSQQGHKGFWKAHAALFEHQSELGDATYRKIAKDLGLQWSSLSAAFKNKQQDSIIAASQGLASDINARGTPSFFINGRKLAGAQPYEKFQALIDEQLERAKALVATGVPRSGVYAKLMTEALAPPEPETPNVAFPAGPRPSQGPRNAKVVIREFSDFQCPFCSRARATLVELQKKYPNDVRLEFRHLPLVFHQQAKPAAEAAMEVFAQLGDAGFWKYHDLLFANQTDLSESNLIALARQIGVDGQQLEQALRDHRHAPTVDADAAAATAGGITGTPAFLVNQYLISGAQPLHSFDRVVQRALSSRAKRTP